MVFRKIPKYITCLMIFIFFLIGVGCSDTAANKSVVQPQTATSKTQPINKVNEASTTVTGQLKIHYINVGQGDSILIQQGSSNMLIDTGTNASTSSLMSY